MLVAFYTQISCAYVDYAPLFQDKNVLITGGSGFIGKALITEILKYNPAKIIIFSRDEVKHYKILAQFNDSRLKSVLGDVRDYAALLDATRNVDVVIHAGALKRLDILESNIDECLKTNILGTVNVARACIENNVKKAVFISSDKACSPVNTYGACKFISEKIFSNNITDSSGTCFVTVRYGNVIESTGSVMPMFCKKIRNNEVIPLTDPAMTRFFITKEQAVELIFKALLYGQGGEIFVPCLPAFKIIDLIEVLHEKFHKKNNVRIVGLRPGEKIHELMINSTEIPRTYKFDNLFIITSLLSTKSNNALYEICGERLNSNTFAEYSSGNSVESQEKLSALLDSYQIDCLENLESSENINK